MSEKLLEHQWNPVNLNDRKGGYNITSYAVSSSWYNQCMDDSGNRRIKLRRYNDMDVNSVEISRALDIIAEDISSSNADDEDMFVLDFDENEKFLKSTVSLLESAKDLWKKRTCLESEFFNRVRDTLKYGSSFWLKNPDGTLKKLYSERMVGYVIDPENEENITHYIYDPSLPRIEDDNKSRVNTSKVGGGTKENYIKIPTGDMLILKIGDGAFGESILDRVFKVWRQMTLIEDAVVIYRVVRAPERRVYYIDVGNLQGPKRQQAIEKQRMSLMQKNATKNNELSAEYDPHSTSEDIFIPTNSTGKGSRIETLPGGQALGQLDDLKWFSKKLAAGLRIPFSMLDVAGDSDERNQHSDMRVGQVYQVEMRYMGYIRRIQRYFATQLEKHFRGFCYAREIVVPETVELSINQPQSFAEYKEIEVNQARMNVAGMSGGFPYISKRFVMEEYLNMDIEQIERNEMQKLNQMGISDEQIKVMEPADRSHLVYAEQPNPAISKKYGIEPAEGGGYGGF